MVQLIKVQKLGGSAITVQKPSTSSHYKSFTLQKHMHVLQCGIGRYDRVLQLISSELHSNDQNT
jgi:hypothetical protein